MKKITQPAVESSLNFSDQVRGGIYGTAVGDSIAAAYETKSAEEVAQLLRSVNDLQMRDYDHWNDRVPAGTYTDDTTQMLLLGESVTEKGFDVVDQFRRYKKGLEDGDGSPENRAVGWGGQTKRVLRAPESELQKRLVETDSKPQGIGSLMRIMSLALWNYGKTDSREVLKQAIDSSSVTHNSDEARFACAAYVKIVHLILDGVPKGEIINRVQEQLPSLPPKIEAVLSRNFQKCTNSDLNPTFLVADALEIALWVWQQFESYRRAIYEVTCLGGDTDTYAAIAGGLIGVQNGVEDIPKEWMGKLRGKERLENLVQEIMN